MSTQNAQNAQPGGERALSLADRLRLSMPGRNQKEMAAELGIDEPTMSRLINGLRPSLFVSRAIVQRFPELRQYMADTLLEVAS